MMGPDIPLYILQEAISAEQNIPYLLTIEICVMNNFSSPQYGELSHKGVVYTVYIFRQGSGPFDMIGAREFVRSWPYDKDWR